jgi:hypothetical protein
LNCLVALDGASETHGRQNFQIMRERLNELKDVLQDADISSSEYALRIKSLVKLSDDVERHVNSRDGYWNKAHAGCGQSHLNCRSHCFYFAFKRRDPATPLDVIGALECGHEHPDRCEECNSIQDFFQKMTKLLEDVDKPLTALVRTNVDTVEPYSIPELTKIFAEIKLKLIYHMQRYTVSLGRQPSETV